MSQVRKRVSALVSFEGVYGESGSPLEAPVTVEVAARASFGTVQSALVNKAFADLGAGATISQINVTGGDRVAEAPPVADERHDDSEECEDDVIPEQLEGHTVFAT